MYPNLFEMFYDLFGVQWLPLKFIQTFGFFVALSFLGANWLMTLELKRKEKSGLILPTETIIWRGKMSPVTDYLSTAVTGFLLGWKILYALLNASKVASDPQGFILSGDGGVLEGLLLAAALTGYKYYTERKAALPEPISETVQVHPYEHMGNLTLLAAVAGFIGAKVFHHLEYWDDFIQDPMGALLSPFSGLTFYGGLITGGIAVLWYASKKGIPWKIMLDVGAPAMMFSYALGRVGCHMSGDGDWGIVNLAPKPGWMSWLPDWMWAYNYPNNVNQVCNPYTGNEALQHMCNWNETPYLIDPVFPTPFYETVVCFLLTALIWSLRKRISIPGILFFFYLILNGIERFFIEKIRVNSEYNLIGLHITQAEIISFIFILSGSVMCYLLWKQNHSNQKAQP